MSPGLSSIAQGYRAKAADMGFAASSTLLLSLLLVTSRVAVPPDSPHSKALGVHHAAAQDVVLMPGETGGVAVPAGDIDARRQGPHEAGETDDAEVCGTSFGGSECDSGDGVVVKEVEDDAATSDEAAKRRLDADSSSAAEGEDVATATATAGTTTGTADVGDGDQVWIPLAGGHSVKMDPAVARRYAMDAGWTGTSGDSGGDDSSSASESEDDASEEDSSADITTDTASTAGTTADVSDGDQVWIPLAGGQSVRMGSAEAMRYASDAGWTGTSQDGAAGIDKEDYQHVVSTDGAAPCSHRGTEEHAGHRSCADAASKDRCSDAEGDVGVLGDSCADTHTADAESINVESTGPSMTPPTTAGAGECASPPPQFAVAPKVPAFIEAWYDPSDLLVNNEHFQDGFRHPDGFEVLGLSGVSLAGPIPTEIGSLTSLKEIYLGELPSFLGRPKTSHNFLAGTLPTEMGRLTSLEKLWLDGNNIRGGVPTTFGALAALEELYLMNNTISASIPTEVGRLSTIKYIRLNDNKLTGKIPSEMGLLSALTWLDLSENSLTHVIPKAFATALVSLRYLFLGENSLSGTVPSEFGSVGTDSNREMMHVLRLHGNAFSGVIPSELGSLTTLRSLWLKDNSLQSAMPTELGRLSQLTDLDVSGNLLTNTPAVSGPASFFCVNESKARQKRKQQKKKIIFPPMCLDESLSNYGIPSELGSLTLLMKLCLYDNKLAGTVPTELGGLAKVTHLELNRNSIQGTIPTEIGRLKSLGHLCLARNSLSGVIPTKIGRLGKTLTTLRLQYNWLSGTMPTELGALTQRLRELWVYANSLTGTIPSELGKLARLTELEINGNLMTGPVPVEILRGLTGLTWISPSMLEMCYGPEYNPETEKDRRDNYKYVAHIPDKDGEQ